MFYSFELDSDFFDSDFFDSDFFNLLFFSSEEDND